METGFAFEDTIAAIATATGEAGIGIVRMSGRRALNIADKIFIPKDKVLPSRSKGYTLHYGWIGLGKNIIDEVLVTIMRGPKSFTCEDVVEINCHGGILALRAVLDLVLENGCRLARPGEFTKRAFLNGRIDLSQAEAVLNIIKAKTDSALKIGMQQLKGRLSGKIAAIRDELLKILALLEANIDFPEEQIVTPVFNEVRSHLETVNADLLQMIEQAKHGKVFREGLLAVICGKPNVGKSSLLNALLKQERSIVTNIAGTTRDTIEEVIDIKGIPVKFVDTAGIIESGSLIEKKAIQRTKVYINSADLILFMFDASKKLSKDDHVLIRRLLRKNKIIIALINKIDLKQRIEKETLLKRFNQVIEISAKKLKNITLLEEAIVQMAFQGKISPPESVLASNTRHAQAIKKAQKCIFEAIGLSGREASLEFIAQDIKEALDYFDEIVGKRFSEDLLDRIFSEFCIGK